MFNLHRSATNKCYMCTKSAEMSFKVRLTTPTASNFTPSVCRVQPILSIRNHYINDIGQNYSLFPNPVHLTIPPRPRPGLCHQLLPPHPPTSSLPGLPHLYLISRTVYSCQGLGTSLLFKNKVCYCVQLSGPGHSHHTPHF